jgi:hypothetical protein
VWPAPAVGWLNFIPIRFELDVLSACTRETPRAAQKGFNSGAIEMKISRFVCHNLKLLAPNLNSSSRNLFMDQPY